MYSNFRGKDELCLAVLDRIRTGQAARIAEAISTGETLEDRLAGVELPLPADEAATALVSLGIGLGLQRAIDHDLPVQTLTNVVRALVLTPRRPDPARS